MPSESTALSTLSRELADTTARVAPAIVQVMGRHRPASGVVTAPGRVLSTSHSVEWENGVRVRTHDGRTLTAEVAGHARGPDLVLLRVADLDAPPLAPAPAPRVGQLALLAGRSWSGGQHARLTIVSGLGGPLDTDDGTRLERVISVPMAPFAGYSGSALLAPEGGLLGLATAGLARGRALALPWSAIDPLVQSLERHGSVKRGFLGVTSQPIRIPQSQRSAAGAEIGLIVVGVADSSPAAAAGLLAGDILVRAAGEAIARPHELLARLGPDRVGSQLVLSVVRGLKREDVTVTVGERPARW